jgi:hypothetical protein
MRFFVNKTNCNVAIKMNSLNTYLRNALIENKLYGKIENELKIKTFCVYHLNDVTFIYSYPSHIMFYKNHRSKELNLKTTSTIYSFNSESSKLHITYLVDWSDSIGGKTRHKINVHENLQWSSYGTPVRLENPKLTATHVTPSFRDHLMSIDL